MALLCSTSYASHSFHSKSTTTTFFFFSSNSSKTFNIHRRGRRTLAAALATKPVKPQHRAAPLRLPPEPLQSGTYSFEVESLINRISRLPPRGSIAKCLESCKNKLSIADFAIVYKEFARRGDWQRSLRLFKYMQRHSWCRPDEHIHAILIGVLGRHNLLLKAHDVFLDMPAYSIPRTALSYTSLINAYGRNGEYEQARSLLAQMKAERIPPTVLTYNIVINACARADLPYDTLLSLFAEMRHDGVHPDIVTYNTLLSAAGARGLPDEAEMVLSTMLDSGVVPDLATHRSLVETFRRLGRTERVAELMEEMVAKGHLPDAEAYNVLIEAFAQEDRPRDAVSVLRQMQAAGCEPTASTYSIILDLYGQKGQYDDVRDLFLEMKVGSTVPDVETYNILLNAFGEGGYFKEVVTLFKDMVEENVRPDMETYEKLLFACGKGGLYDEAKNVLVRMSYEGVVPSTKAYTGFVEACGQVGFYEEAFVAFNTMHEVESAPDAETYNSLIYTYGRGGLFKEAQAVSLRMNNAWIERNTDSFTGLIESYVQGGQYDNAVKTYVEMQKSRCGPSERTLEAVLSAYCMAELVDESKEQFEEIGRSVGGTPSIMACCTMLSLYAKQERWQDMNELLTQMKSTQSSSSHNVIAAMIAGEYDAGTNWQMVEYVFDKCSLEGCDFGSRFYNALLDALWWLNQKERAARVLEEARERGLYPELIRQSKLVWSVDVHSSTPWPPILSDSSTTTHLKERYKTSTRNRTLPNWQMVEYVFEKCTLEGCDFGSRFYNALLDALWWFNQKERAARVLEEARERGLYPELIRQSKLVWSVDVHRMSIGGALTAVSVWLNDIHGRSKSEKYPPQIASVVVARGLMEKTNATKVLPLPKAVFSFLKENISSSFHFPGWNKGRIVCQRSQLKKLQSGATDNKESDRESERESDRESDKEEERLEARESLIPLVNLPIVETRGKEAFREEEKEAELLPI